MALLSTSEVAKIYGFSTSQVRRLIREGLIKCRKVGTFYAIDERSVKNLTRRRTLANSQKESI